MGRRARDDHRREGRRGAAGSGEVMSVRTDVRAGFTGAVAWCFVGGSNIAYHTTSNPIGFPAAARPEKANLKDDIVPVNADTFAEIRLA
jgi:hypothetical protein